MKYINKFQGVILVAIVSLFASCGIIGGKYYDVDFFVKNNCDEKISVYYTIRVCTSDLGCFPEDFSNEVTSGDSVVLYVRDEMTEDAVIGEDIFFEFEIYKGSEKSNKYFWNSESLIEKKLDGRYEYILTVDSTFFHL